MTVTQATYHDLYASRTTAELTSVLRDGDTNPDSRLAIHLLLAERAGISCDLTTERD